MHCHLDLYPRPHEVSQTCLQKNLYILSVTTTPSAWRGTKSLAGNNSRIRTALGLHPQVAHLRKNELEIFDELVSKTKYIGEVGLDGSKAFKPFWKDQLLVFRHILKTVNNSGGKIISIHSKGAAENVLAELRNTECLPILHWFTGSKKQLEKAIDMGCWFSVGPAMLKTKNGQSIVKKVPKSKILLETDGPFAKIGGAIIMPWNIDIAVTQLSETLNMPSTEVNSLISRNTKNLLWQNDRFNRSKK